MRTYRVVWEIDVAADSPQAAAEQACSVMQDTDAAATCFTVVGADGKKYDVDLKWEDGRVRVKDEAGNVRFYVL